MSILDPQQLAEQIATEVINRRGYMVIARNFPAKIGAVIDELSSTYGNSLKYKFRIYQVTDVIDYFAQVNMIGEMCGRPVRKIPAHADKFYYYRVTTD